VHIIRVCITIVIITTLTINNLYSHAPSSNNGANIDNVKIRCNAGYYPVTIKSNSTMRIVCKEQIRRSIVKKTHKLNAYKVIPQTTSRSVQQRESKISTYMMPRIINKSPPISNHENDAYGGVYVGLITQYSIANTSINGEIVGLQNVPNPSILSWKESQSSRSAFGAIGTLGYNHLIFDKNVLIGIEADVPIFSKIAFDRFISGYGGTIRSLKNIGNINMQIGSLVHDIFLFYVKAGVGYSNVQYRADGENAVIIDKKNETHIGLNIGGGAEIEVWDRIHLRLEYLYTWYQPYTQNFHRSDIASNQSVAYKYRINTHVLRFGIVYHF